MKKNIKLLSALLIGGTLFLSACSKDDTPAATTYYQQADQFGTEVAPAPTGALDRRAEIPVSAGQSALTPGQPRAGLSGRP